MINTRNCPTCQTENPSDATICTRCGTTLVALLPSNTTVRVPDAPPKPSSPKHIVELTQLYADALVFQVLGHEQPVLVKGGGKVLIGRYTPGDAPPSIDLNPYNGAILGVSRHHAQILRVDNVYTIQDLGSTNGTYLNEARLTPNQPQPLNNGDLLRLGQLGAYIYFRSENTAQAEETILLRYVSEGANAFDWTAKSWLQLVMPYLAAFTELEAICDQLHSRQPAAVLIHTITHDIELGVIRVVSSGASEALIQLKAAMASKKQAQPDNGVPPSTNGTISTSPTGSLEPSLAETLAQLSDKIVKEISPGLSEADQKSVSERLLTVLSTLVNHPLELASR